MEKYINILKNTPLFQGISEAEILPMLKCLSVSIKNYSKGEYLLRSGDKVQTIGMILSGQALIDKGGGNGNLSLHGWTGEGDGFAGGFYG